MATTQNTYTGNGSTVLYSFTFPYLETTDIKVSLNGTVTTAYTLANATTIQFTTAPANGAAIRIYRQTDDSGLQSTFYPGSAIRSSDLNVNFTQNLYVTQESNREASSAISAANSATSIANNAVATANAATVTANSAVGTANAATASAASASASAASAVTTANAASASAASAVSSASTANANATAALNAISQALVYTIVADVAAIPVSPSNGDAVSVVDSTGIESFTPLSTLPAGFIGDSGLTVDIYYSSSTSTWVWVRYYATDPETRYVSGAALTAVESDVSTLQSDFLLLDSAKLDATTAASTYLTQASAGTTYQTQSGMSSYLTTTAAGTTYAPLASPTFTGQPYVNGSYRGNITAVTALDIDCSLGNLFTKTINANSTFTVSNVPASRSYTFTLELTHTSGTITWFSGVIWPGGTAPTLTTGKVHLFMFFTDDGGTTWRASSLINY
jgi:hypothetical protein